MISDRKCECHSVLLLVIGWVGWGWLVWGYTTNGTLHKALDESP